MGAFKNLVANWYTAHLAVQLINLPGAVSKAPTLTLLSSILPSYFWHWKDKKKDNELVGTLERSAAFKDFGSKDSSHQMDCFGSLPAPSMMPSTLIHLSC